MVETSLEAPCSTKKKNNKNNMAMMTMMAETTATIRVQNANGVAAAQVVYLL